MKQLVLQLPAPGTSILSSKVQLLTAAGEVLPIIGMTINEDRITFEVFRTDVRVEIAEQKKPAKGKKK